MTVERSLGETERLSLRFVTNNIYFLTSNSRSPTAFSLVYTNLFFMQANVFIMRLLPVFVLSFLLALDYCNAKKGKKVKYLDGLLGKHSFELVLSNTG